MRFVRRGPWITRPVIGALVVLLAGCSTDVAPGPGLPTFPGSGAPSATGNAAVHDVGVLPDDCARVLPVADLVAVLGLPLDSVVVRTTNGVPAQSIGRIERIDCAYSGTAAAGPDSGHSVLTVHAAAYSSTAAAHDQWTRNAANEDGRHLDLPVGAATGVLVERPGETLLSVQYGSGTLGLDLPGRPLPGDADAAAMLVDLARRVLPTIAATAPSATASFAPSSGLPSSQIESSSAPASTAPLRAAGTG